MTVKDELHTLIDRLPERDTQDALDYLRARTESNSRPDSSFIQESQTALNEATAANAVHVPHAAVRTWLQTWGTPDEEAAEEKLSQLEDRLRRDARDSAAE